MRNKNFDADLLHTLNEQPMPAAPLTDDEFARVLDAACAKLPQAKKNFRLFAGGETFFVDGLRVQSMPISHDAAEPVAYRIDGGGHDVVTVGDDLGERLRSRHCASDDARLAVVKAAHAVVGVHKAGRAGVDGRQGLGIRCV